MDSNRKNSRQLRDILNKDKLDKAKFSKDISLTKSIHLRNYNKGSVLTQDQFHELKRNQITGLEHIDDKFIQANSDIFKSPKLKVIKENSLRYSIINHRTNLREEEKLKFEQDLNHSQIKDDVWHEMNHELRAIKHKRDQAQTQNQSFVEKQQNRSSQGKIEIEPYDYSRINDQAYKHFNKSISKAIMNNEFISNSFGQFEEELKTQPKAAFKTMLRKDGIEEYNYDPQNSFSNLHDQPMKSISPKRVSLKQEKKNYMNQSTNLHKNSSKNVMQIDLKMISPKQRGMKSQRSVRSNEDVLDDQQYKIKNEIHNKKNSSLINVSSTMLSDDLARINQ